MNVPLRLMLPHAWRWPHMSYAARCAQLALDARMNAQRYAAIAAEPDTDPYAYDAITRYLPGGLRRVLEVGAGTGTYTAGLPGKERYANEPVESRWATLRAKVPDVQRIGGTAYALHAATDTFDAVVVLHVLHHLADRPRAWAEWARVLKPGGRLVLVEPRHTWRRAARLGYVWATEYRTTRDPSTYATHDYCTRREIRALCGGAGLTLVDLPRIRRRIVAFARKAA